MRALAIVTFGLAALAMAGAAGVRASELEVDLELVLAVDVSNSVDDGEHAIQRAGYVEAIRHPDVWAAIERGILGRIALTYIEWAGPEKQRVTLPWHVIDSPQAARAAAEALAAEPIFFTRGTGTSISRALIFSVQQIESNGIAGLRRVIDISGDGPNNRGMPPDVARDGVIARRITINGLPLVVRPAADGVAIDEYYEACVIGGPGAFLMPVRQADQLAPAIRHKLVREIANRGGPPRDPVVLAQTAPEVECRPDIFLPGWPSPT